MTICWKASMKFHTRAISRLASVSVLLLASMGALTAQTVLPSGSFGFLLGTSFTDPTNQGGAAIIGEMRFDGAGNVHGPFTLEYGSGGPLAATTIAGTFSGTYSSNPDGTGSISITLTHGIALTLAMVIANSGSLYLTVTSCTGAKGIDLAASVLSGVGVHTKGSVSNSLAALQGSYGDQLTYSPQAFSSMGVATFDGAGNVTMALTFVGIGPSVGSASFPGTYTVSPNAMGSITLTAQAGQGAQTFVFVITNDGGAGLLLMQINRSGDGVAIGTAHLQ
jgi:hypothetical protein